MTALFTLHKHTQVQAPTAHPPYVGASANLRRGASGAWQLANCSSWHEAFANAFRLSIWAFACIRFFSSGGGEQILRGAATILGEVHGSFWSRGDNLDGHNKAGCRSRSNMKVTSLVTYLVPNLYFAMCLVNGIYWRKANSRYLMEQLMRAMHALDWHGLKIIFSRSMIRIGGM